MSHAPTATLDARHAALRSSLADLGIDALVVTSRPNVIYLTNFTGSAGVVVLRPDSVQLVTDFRYVEEVEAQQRAGWACPGMALVRVDTTYDETVLASLRGCRRVGFEGGHLTVSRSRWFERSLAGGGEWVPTDGLVEQARLVKDAWEIGTLREAGRRLSGAARQVLASVAAGQSESDVAWHIAACLREAGFEKPAFDTIVASGPNGALPHARPGKRILSEGDLVVLDFGGVYDSYCVDLTRTVAIGRSSDLMRDVYEAVRDAHDRAIALVAPGVSRFAIDAAARECLTSWGLGEAFGHGTGHGLGIEVHEDPRIGRRRVTDVTDDPVRPGMVFTIEPGAYLPGWGGVRIEDDVLVTTEGVEALTDVPTDLLER